VRTAGDAHGSRPATTCRYSSTIGVTEGSIIATIMIAHITNTSMRSGARHGPEDGIAMSTMSMCRMAQSW